MKLTLSTFTDLSFSRNSGRAGRRFLITMLALLFVSTGCERHEFPPPTARRIAPQSATELADLEVANIVTVPDRVRFMAAAGDPAQLDKLSVLINTIDQGTGGTSGRAAAILKERHPRGERFEVKAYDPKHVVFRNGVGVHLPLLTVFDRENGVEVKLLQGEVVNIPTFYAVLRYSGAGPEIDMNKRRGDTFTLPVRHDKIFTILQIKPTTQDSHGRVTHAEVIVGLPADERTVKKFFVRVP